MEVGLVEFDVELDVELEVELEVEFVVELDPEFAHWHWHVSPFQLQVPPQEVQPACC